MIKKRFKEFIGTGTLTIFDIDETLFHTKAKVAVVKDGRVVRMLDNQEFNTYKRKPGEEYDFREFKSAEVFRRTSTPISKMINKAKAIVKAKSNPHSKAIIVTARADFDDKDMFLQTYLKAFLELQAEYPDVVFEAWFVNHDGSVKRIR